MSLVAVESTKRLSTKKSHGRVINEIAALFRRRLSVPHIYLKPQIPGPVGVDVLAVDRGGSGDVHGVEIMVKPIVPTHAEVRKLATTLRSLPVHFRYIAMNSNSNDHAKWDQLREYDELFDPSGIGRVGVIAYDDRLLQKNAEFDSSLISIIVPPERFLVRGEKLEVLERFLDRVKPDIQVRI